MEDKTFELEEQPGYKLAIPLFLLTALPFFGGLAYDYINCREVDQTFIWLGCFYALTGLAYWGRKTFILSKD